MKKLICTLVIIFTFFFGIAQTNKYRYFDTAYKQISKETFDAQLESREFLEINGENENEKQLIERENRGQIENVANIYEMLEKHTAEEFDRTKPLVVIFYPGKDENNSGGANDKISLRSRRNQLWKGLDEIAGIKPIYLYKDNDGLKKYRNVITWYPDPESFFENNFFKHHYPGYSFVVISPTGKYISYFGEFPKEFIWEATRQLTSVN